MKKYIDLKSEYRANSTIFAGRNEGEAVRRDLMLDEKDKDDDTYIVRIPKDTTSINSSFFLGLFYQSIKNLGGLDKFDEKYIIDLSEMDKELQMVLEQDISDDRRKANNVVNSISILDIKRK